MELTEDFRRLLPHQVFLIYTYDTNFLLISSIKPELQLNLLVVGNLGAAVEHMQSEANLHLLIKFGIPRGFGN